MARDPNDYPSNYEIRSAAEALRDAAIKVRGQVELHYIPKDAPDHVFAGKTPEEVQQATGSLPHGHDSFGHSGPYTLDESGRYQGTTEQWASIETAYDWIVESFEKFSEPLPFQFEEPAQQSTNAAKQLFDAETGIDEGQAPRDTAGAAIDTWQGTGAEAFKANAWYRIPNIAKRQAAMAGFMAHSLLAARDTYAEGRVSAKNIADKGKVAIEALIGEEGASSAAADLTVLAGVITVAAGVLTLPLTGGGSSLAVGAGIATISAGVATMAAGGASYPAPPEAKKPELGGATVTDVLMNVIDAQSEIRTDIETNEEKIKGDLETQLATLNSGEPAENHSTGYGNTTFTKKDNLTIPKPAMVDDADNLDDPPNL